MPLLLSATKDVLIRAGLESTNAEIMARGLVVSQRDGRPAHGLARLPAIVRSLQSGEVAGNAKPQVARLRPAVLQVDAMRGFALPAISHAMQDLADAARSQGVAALSVVDARGIVGALWVPLEQIAADHGLAVLACCNTPAFVCPAGGSRPVLGTNPLGFAWPRTSAPPMVLDFSSAAISRGAVQEAARHRTALPAGCALDAWGRPTTDAAAALEGAQLAFGGHKGGLCALLVELLAAAWIGSELAVEGGSCSEGGRMRRGLCLLAFDLAAHTSTLAARQRAERLFAAVLEAGGRLPADSRYALRQSSELAGEGGSVSVSRELLQSCFGGTDLGRFGGTDLGRPSHRRQRTPPPEQQPLE